MSSTRFLNDRERGREGQHFVAEMLRFWNLEVEEVKDGMFPDYDLKLANGKTIEVKADFMANKTGNLALELEALDHSKADLLAIYVKPPVTVYFKELDEVRKFAHSWHKKVRGGEFGNEIALVPRSIFLDRMKPQIFSVNP
jgi:hypothetical protein